MCSKPCICNGKIVPICDDDGLELACLLNFTCAGKIRCCTGKMGVLILDSYCNYTFLPVQVKFTLVQVKVPIFTMNNTRKAPFLPVFKKLHLYKVKTPVLKVKLVLITLNWPIFTCAGVNLKLAAM